MILKQFQLNRGTGGEGRYRGGDGVIREVMFRKQLTICLMSERRSFRPYGLKGKEGTSSPTVKWRKKTMAYDTL